MPYLGRPRTGWNTSLLGARRAHLSAALRDAVRSNPQCASAFDSIAAARCDYMAMADAT